LNVLESLCILIICPFNKKSWKNNIEKIMILRMR